MKTHKKTTKSKNNPLLVTVEREMKEKIAGLAKGTVTKSEAVRAVASYKIANGLPVPNLKTLLAIVHQLS